MQKACQFILLYKTIAYDELLVFLKFRLMVKLTAVLKSCRLDQCGNADEKKPARRPVFCAACRLVASGGSSRSSRSGSVSRSSSGVSGSSSVSSGSSHISSRSGRSRSFDGGSSSFRSRSFFFFATSGQGESQQSGEQDGIFHLCISLKVLINMLIASVFAGSNGANGRHDSKFFDFR